MIAEHLRGNLLGRLVSHVQDLDALSRQWNAGLAEQPAHGARMARGDAETAVRRTSLRAVRRASRWAAISHKSETLSNPVPLSHSRCNTSSFTPEGTT